MTSTAQEATILKHHQRSCIDGSHILHYHNVVDAYGHLSFRHPIQRDCFVMSHSIAPGLISSPDDLITYRIGDAEPVEPTTTSGYAERRIHSEIYKRFPNVNSVVHSHSEAVVPFTVSNLPLKPCCHTAGFLGANGPAVFDSGRCFGPTEVPDMLVRTQTMGAALAEKFDTESSVVLMRGHGFTAVAESIELAVYRALYTQKNATILTTALTLKRCAQDINVPGKMLYLSEAECKSVEVAAKWSLQRPWTLWLREVKMCNLYTNSIQ